jgi:hypothetical protein
MRRLQTTIATVCLGFLLPVATARGLCPLNQGRIGVLQNCGSPQSTEPVFSASQSSTCINGFGSVGYDLRTGAFEVHSRSTSHEGFHTWLQTQDEFVIEGPASATPIPVSALFTGTWNRAELYLSSGTTIVSDGSDAITSRTLRLDLQKLPGESFIVTVRGDAAAHLGFADIQGAMRFTSLPPGYSLRSCQGFAGVPVAVRTSSWGRIKQIYR